MKKNKILITLACLLFSSFTFSMNKKNVLYIGDSQSEGHLGRMVYNALSQSKKVKEAHVYGFGSSSPRHWQQPVSSLSGSWLIKRTGRHNKGRLPLKDLAGISSDQSILSYFLNDHRPDVFIFQFLGNSMKMSEDYIISNVKGILEQLNLYGVKKCIYISSPPYHKSLPDKNKMRISTQKHFLKALKDPNDSKKSLCKIIKGVTKDTLKNFAANKLHYAKDLAHLSKKGAKEFMKLIRPHLP